METKRLPAELCEFKFNDDDWKVTGYASVFNSIDKVGDTIIPGAFQKSIESGVEIKMFYEHLRFMKPGKWDSLKENDKGLHSVGYLTRDHSLANDVRAEMRHGTTHAFSIGFTIPKGGYSTRDDGGRDLHEIDLIEISLTGNPAEPKAVIESFKSELETIENIKEFEAFLREAGNFSRSMAKLTIGKAKTLVQSESVTERNERMRELKALADRYDLRNLLK